MNLSNFYNRMEWAKSEVPNTPSFTCGQGMKEADTDQMPGDEISLKLNEASGIESLKQKYVRRWCLCIYLH